MVVDPDAKLTTLDVIPTIYVMTQPAKALSKYNSRTVDALREDAFEWAEDGVTAASVPLVINMLAQKLLDLRRVAPEIVEDCKKKPSRSQLTAG